MAIRGIVGIKDPRVRDKRQLTYRIRGKWMFAVNATITVTSIAGELDQLTGGHVGPNMCLCGLGGERDRDDCGRGASGLCTSSYYLIVMGSEQNSINRIDDRTDLPSANSPLIQ